MELPQTSQDRLLSFVLTHAIVRTNVCSRQVFEDGYRLNPRMLPDYNLIYTTRGEPVWVFDQPITLGPGKLLLVPPGAPHSGYSRTAAMSLVSLHVDVTLPGGRDAFSLLTPPRVQDVRPGSRLDRYLRGAMDEFDRPDSEAQRLMLPHWCRLVVLELLRHDAAADLLTWHPLDPLIDALLDLLGRRLSQPTTLADLVQATGFTAQHVNRVFRRDLGITPLQYLTRLRLDRAAALLAEDRLTVAAIAEEVGYEDPFYFSRVFRQHFGLSPSQYRESLLRPM